MKESSGECGDGRNFCVWGGDKIYDMASVRDKSVLIEKPGRGEDVVVEELFHSFEWHSILLNVLH